MYSLIFITELYPDYSTHHHVVFGYDERTKTLFVHNPWAFSNDSVYQGPKSIMSIKDDSWFGNQWLYGDYQVAVVRSISLSLELESSPITKSRNYVLNCTFDNSFMNQAKDLRLQLSFHTWYSLFSGSTTREYTDLIGKTTHSWNVVCPTPTLDDFFTVKITTLNEEMTFGGKEKIYPSQLKSFVTIIFSNYLADIPPCMVNITAELDCSEILPLLYIAFLLNLINRMNL